MSERGNECERVRTSETERETTRERAERDTLSENGNE